MVKILVDREDEGARHPIFRHYESQFHPQDGLIELDLETGTMWAAYNPEIGNAVPMRVHHGHVLRFSVSPYLSGTQLNELMDELVPVAERIVAGYESRWNGSNHVAHLTKEAQAAFLELSEQAETESGPFRIDIESCLDDCDVCWPDEA